MEDKIKGFSKDEIFELYRFVEIYESDINRKYITEIRQKYPKFAKKEWNKIKTNLKHLSVMHQNGYKGVIPPNTLFDGEIGIVRLRVVTHIRNAFVHNTLEKDSHYPCIFLTDKYKTTDREGKYKKGDVSARYFFDESMFWKIIRIFTQPQKS